MVICTEQHPQAGMLAESRHGQGPALPFPADHKQLSERRHGKSRFEAAWILLEADQTKPPTFFVQSTSTSQGRKQGKK